MRDDRQKSSEQVGWTWVIVSQVSKVDDRKEWMNVSVKKKDSDSYEWSIIATGS